MNIHEYQAKAVLSKYGVAVPKGKVADTPAEAEVIAEEFGTAGRRQGPDPRRRAVARAAA